jgi:two-component system OmpR family response regulator
MLLTLDELTSARPNGAAAPPGRRVMVVEDTPDARAALDAMLRRCGMQTACAATLAGALRLLAWQPDAIVLDLMLPDGNGVEILRRVRTGHMPIIVAVITAASDYRLLDEVQALQPDAFFKKPLDWKALCEWLANQ